MTILALLGSKLGRWAMLALAGFAVVALAAARVFAAGEAKAKLADAHAAIKDATARAQVDDAVAKGGDAAARTDLGKWERKP